MEPAGGVHAWRSPAFGGALGACHAVELPFVFDALAEPGFAPLLGGTQALAPEPASSAPTRALARAVHRAWVSLATDGGPGRPSYDERERAVMVFDTVPATVADPRGKPRALWEGRR